MEAEYLLKNFIRIGEKMRNAQKGYFSTKSYQPELKKEYLATAKQAEKEFDNLLFNAKQLVK